jgi:hypothetical protein
MSLSPILSVVLLNLKFPYKQMSKKRWTTGVQKGPPEFWIQWSGIPPAEKVSVETWMIFLHILPYSFIFKIM